MHGLNFLLTAQVRLLFYIIPFLKLKETMTDGSKNKLVQDTDRQRNFETVDQKERCAGIFAKRQSASDLCSHCIRLLFFLQTGFMDPYGSCMFSPLHIAQFHRNGGVGSRTQPRNAV